MEFKSKKLRIVLLSPIIAVIALFFLLRLPNLTSQPIFADEAIYIRWAQVMKAEPTLRFLPLSDGKTPLFMWAMIPFFKIFPDPLYAGRFLSTFSGFLTLLGGLFLGWKFFKFRVGLLSAFLIATIPYMVFYDRMALVDSLLAAFSLWSLIVALLLVKYPRFDLAMVLGYLIGGAILTKPPGMFNLFSLPAVLLTFNFSQKDRLKRVIRLALMIGVTLIITFTIYNLLRLGPGFSSLSSRNQDYIFSLDELKGRYQDPFIPHIFDLADWLPKTLTIPGLLLLIFSIALTFIKRDRVALVIFFWGFIPLLIEMVFLRTFTGRYILFSIPPFLVLSACGLELVFKRFKNWLLQGVIILMIFIPTVYTDYLILTNPEIAPLPNEARRGYFEQWTAGYGLKETAQYLISEAKKGSIVVGTEGSFGTLPDGLQIYLEQYINQTDKDHYISIVPGKAEVSNELWQASLKHPTFFVTNKSRFPSPPPELILIKEYPKQGGKDASQLFKVTPKKYEDIKH